MTNPTMDVVNALYALLGKIKRPTYRSAVRKVRIGLTAADLNGSEQPMLAVFYTGETGTLKPYGKAHEYRIRMTVFCMTSDTDDAMGDLVALIEDVKDALKTDERLGSRLLVPIIVTNVDAVLDLDAGAGIGTARIDLEALYRTTHA